MTLFRVNIPWGVRSVMPRAVTMYGPCSIHFLLGVTTSSPGSSTIRPRRARRGDSQLGYPSVCTFFPEEVIMFLFSRPFFSYQGKLRVVPGQL